MQEVLTAAKYLQTAPWLTRLSNGKSARWNVDYKNKYGLTIMVFGKYKNYYDDDPTLNRIDVHIYGHDAGGNFSCYCFHKDYHDSDEAISIGDHIVEMHNSGSLARDIMSFCHDQNMEFECSAEIVAKLLKF